MALGLYIYTFTSLQSEDPHAVRVSLDRLIHGAVQLTTSTPPRRAARYRMICLVLIHQTRVFIKQGGGITYLKC